MRDIDDMDMGFFLHALRGNGEKKEPKPKFIDELGLF